jgi:hypothetical protein
MIKGMAREKNRRMLEYLSGNYNMIEYLQKEQAIEILAEDMEAIPDLTIFITQSPGWRYELPNALWLPL